MQQQQVKNKDREKIELYFSGRGLADKDVLSQSDPQCYIYLKEGQDGQERLIGKTEVKDNNLNPDWKTSVVLDFIFEVNQFLRIVVMDHDGKNVENDDIIGSLNTTIGAVMGSKNQIYLGQLTHNHKKTGRLIIKADNRKEIGEENQMICWQWNATKVKNMDGWFGVSDPFLRFLKWHKNSDWLLVHETEFIKNNENPTWKPFEIPHDKLHDENPQQPFKIELWDNQTNGKHQFIGAIEVTIEQIIFKEIHQFVIKTPKGDLGGNLGVKFIEKKDFALQMGDQHTFIDYLKGGDQINLIIAIDFTGSNGEPSSPHSLHYNDPEHLNQYQNALKQVAEILLNYDYDKKVPLYGFGGVPSLPNYKKTSVEQCFPLNGNQSDPEVFGLDGIMSTYSNALNHINLSGPTIFGPVIENALEISKANLKKDIYSVLLIMTDGQIDDMNHCLKLIRKAYRLPLSIIIVGVGNANFNMMEQLDGDDAQLERDLVQFVPFIKHSQQPGELAKELLAELPDQFLRFKKLIGKKPNPSKEIDLSQIN
ncbi:unnamed protein product [Paramecium octaurelia]|uniref:C2 domain-containing protein n=1 Tax=Paramecium octaurelia TaxID=43137 RepID=A0A8S1U628_PAROT|nr:unnamed protein product [Paramecium octaurelia]